MTAPTLLSYGPSNVDETLTLTWSNLVPGIKDNVFKENTLLGWMTKHAKKKVKGGASISHGIMYGKSTSGGSYSRYEQLDVTPQDGLTRDQWPWKQYYWSIAMDGFTERVNQGEWAIDDAMETKKKQAEMSMKEDIEIDLFAASPGSSDIRSLPVLILGSGTEGQINGTTSTWWASQALAAGSWAAGIGRSKLTTLTNTIDKLNPAGKPEVFVSDSTSLEAYEGTLVANYRYSDGSPDIGATKLTFKNIPWLHSVQATSGVIYALHSDAIDMVVHSNCDFIVTPFTKPGNQDAKVGQILAMLAVTTNNRRKLGKTTANAA